MAMATQTQTHNQTQTNWKFPAANVGKLQSSPTNTGSNNLTLKNLKSVPSPPIRQKPTTINNNGRNLTHKLNENNEKQTLSFSQVRRKLEESRKLFLHQQNDTDDEDNLKICEEKSLSGLINVQTQIKVLSTDKVDCVDCDVTNEPSEVVTVCSQSTNEVLTRLSSSSSTQNPDEPIRSRPTKKISFKIRKNASIYRRKAPDAKTLNLVQELTKKYNELDEQQHNQGKIRLVKRNSNNLKRKPSQTQPKSDVKVKTPDSVENTNVKQAIAIFEQKCTTNLPVATSGGSGGNVKPRVAAKTFDAKAIAARNQEKRMRLQKKLNNSIAANNQSNNNIEMYTMPRCNSAIVTDLRNVCEDIALPAAEVVAHGDENMDDVSASTHVKQNTSVTNRETKLVATTTTINKMDACDSDELQVVSLPMAMVKRCESNYECQKFAKYQQARLSLSQFKTSEETNATNKTNSRGEASKTKLVDEINACEQKTVNVENENSTCRMEIDGATATGAVASEKLKVLSLDDDYEFVVPPDDELLSNDEKNLNNKTEEVPPLPPRSNKLSQIYTSIKATLTPSIGQKPLNSDKTTSGHFDDNVDDDYEIPEAPSTPDTLKSHEENIYESLSRCSRSSDFVDVVESEDLTKFRTRKSSAGLSRNQHEPLPPRPPSSASSTPSIEYENDESNYYESIYSKRDDNYESIYGGSRLECGVNGKRNSISVQSVQSDQQSNSIYGRSITSWAEEVMDTYISGSCVSFNGSSSNGSQNGGSVKAVSELSGSSDDWVDISDHECDEDGRKNKFVIVREARHQKVTKKNSGWSQRIRGQWNKVPKKMHHGDTDSDHTYETLYGSDGQPLGAQNGGHSITHHQQQHQHHQQYQMPELHHHPATHEIEGHLDDDDDFDSFESDSESDNSFAKTDSGVDMGNTQLPEPPANQTYAFTRFAASAGKNVMKRLRRNWSMRKNDISKSLSRITKRKSRTDLDTIEPMATPSPITPQNSTQDKHTVGRRGFLNKFKRSMSMTGDLGDQFSDRPKSTFYVTDPIDLNESTNEINAEPKIPERKSKNHLVRPQMPPPPAPISPTPSSTSTPTPPSSTKTRSQSWYAECGVFKPDSPAPALPRRPNSFWYAEVGLYQSGSPPSTSTSSENSGNSSGSNNVNSVASSATYETKPEPDYYYNTSVKSYDSNDTKKDEAFNSLQGDIQLRLQDEPLYQFYDAAVLESVCNSGLSDMYDDYEEIAKDKRTSFASRPSAMEIVSPRNNVSVARTLWCEIPEVVQSTVLSTLSIHQKKLQEAKFEMLTSEASYLNSLHVLTEHFVKRLRDSELLNDDDKEILCGKILPVKECSEKLLSDLERCWQENILLHRVCDIVKTHAEENFGVYVSYCENQIVLDQTLKKLKERPNFVEFIRQLEANSVCQLLTLYSFLMLPMQRITRWPLLVDAILKRLSPQDDEYHSCQYALATLNKIVMRCNEGARNMERITEMRKLAGQMDFGRGVPPFDLVNGKRWLVRSGPLTQMLNRGDDVKLTFGKRFTKIPIHLFLFNDIVIVAKSKGDGVYIVQHYCSRSYLELNSESLATLPMKDTQGRHLIFLTILENHDEKTVEMLLSCASESDRERWMEALTPPKSENPEETLYECWDCPQVTAVHNYIANQPDELPITRGDVINVTRKMADGWFHGERIRDGETGWFPANYTVEVANPHVRARNLKQRYRLLAYSENYLKSK